MPSDMPSAESTRPGSGSTSPSRHERRLQGLEGSLATWAGGGGELLIACVLVKV